MSIVIWLVGLVGLITGTGLWSARGRASPGDAVSRRALAVAGLALAALVAGASWVWGGRDAVAGRAARLAEGAPVSIALRAVRAPLDRDLTIGRGTSADVRVAGEGNLPLARLVSAAASVSVVAASPAVLVSSLPGSADAKLLADALAARCAPAPQGRGASDRSIPAPTAAGARAAAEPALGHGPHAGDVGLAASLPLMLASTVVAVECGEAGPRIALAIQREPAPRRGEHDHVAVQVLGWRGRFTEARLATRAGEVLRLGDSDGAIPGVATWQAAAVRGATALLVVPQDPTRCAAWSLEGGATQRTPGSCLVSAGAYQVSAISLIPDPASVLARGWRIGLVVGGPALAALLALMLARRRARRAEVVARALRLAVLSAGLTALGCWRSLWAYRIDVLRDLAPEGARLTMSLRDLAAVGAALAGVAALVLSDPTASLRRRSAIALATWAVWLTAGWVVLGVEPSTDLRGLGALACSLAAALIPLAPELARPLRAVPIAAVLSAIALAAVTARWLVPAAPLIKLGLAYAVVLAGHAALRTALARSTPTLVRAQAIGALAAGAVAVACLDTGVALAIVGPGLALAMLVAGHDAAYDASQGLRLGVLEREHARLVLAHGLAAIAASIAATTVALLATDRELLEGGAGALMNAPLVASGLFALAAVIARSHRRGWLPWLAAALAALAIWGARGDLLDRVTAGEHTAARRVAAIVDPGYALLRDERAFAANVAAWQEATLSPSAAVSPWHGEGYFGARVRDPGVARSIDNDYLPVLVARERGLGGLLQGVALLLLMAVAGGVLASVRHRHASPQHRSRWLIAAVVGTVAVYQPLAALGVLPLTGISWPGLGIDSPADLWLFVLGGVWCFAGGDRAEVEDERVRRTPRLARARAVAIAALGVAALAGAAVVARAGASALARVTAEDGRIDAALAYAETIRCPWSEREPAPGDGSIDELVPDMVVGEPSDAATERFERELRAAWAEDRPRLLAALRAGSVPAPATAAARPPRAATRHGAAAATPPSPAAGRETAVQPPVRYERSARGAASTRARSGRPAEARAAGAGAAHRSARDRASAPRAGDAVPRDAATPPAREAAEPAASAAAHRLLDPAELTDGVDEPAAPLLRPASVTLALDACRGAAGRWRLVRSSTSCVATFRAGWPAVQLTLRAANRGAEAGSPPGAASQIGSATCMVTRSADALSVLRQPRPRGRAPRIRVVSAAIGLAAADVGEVIAGDRVVRLRPGSPELQLAGSSPGFHVASRLTLVDGVALEIRTSPRAIVLSGGAELLLADPRGGWRRASTGALPPSEAGRARLARGSADAAVPASPARRADGSAGAAPAPRQGVGDTVIDRPAIIVAGPPAQRVLVLVRAARIWGGESVVDSLLADETQRIGDRARRAYPYGAALPELGWVSPHDLRRSVGLDGWIHAAHARGAEATLERAAAPECGALRPPAVPRERICTRSPHDGVLECRVAIQPELALTLRGLAERLASDPAPLTGRAVPPVRIAYAVLRGDTGELLAQANIVPGRSPLGYAPPSIEAEAALVRAREVRGESDLERVEWNLPIAVGSTFKPIVARAIELSAPYDVERLALAAGGMAQGCPSRRGSVGPVLGHCPPTSVAGAPPAADLHDFLARSPNWYQMAIGMLGLGLPSGRFTVGDTPVSLEEIAASDLGAWPTSSPLEVADGDGAILSARGLSIAGLRRTPMWTAVERLLGRPVCTLGSRSACERAAARADLCGTRALPISDPSSDLRYLVALGPDRIDLYADDRRGQSSVPVREYLQLLRGSGVHAVGSLLQITDAFGRVIYDPEARALAASWFPTPTISAPPTWSCSAGAPRAPSVRGAGGGLCGVLRPGGTAHAGAGSLLEDPAIYVYGAKTGTVDSLAEIARRPRACAAWNARHAPRARLECGKPPPDDSLFVIAFGVITPRGTIPVTLGLQLQRAGSGAAARAAPTLVSAIAKYLRGA